MSNKNLLNESTIRKFMKLASIEPLASDFLGRIQEAEEEIEEGHGHKDKDKDALEEAEEELEEGHGHDDKKELDEAEEDVDEAHCPGKADEEERMEEEFDIDEMGGDMAYKDDEDDLGVDLGAAEAGADKMLNMDDFLDILEKAVEEFLGEPTDIERDEEPAGDEEMELPDDDELADAGEDLGLDPDSEEDREEDLAESIYREVLKKISKKK